MATFGSCRYYVTFIDDFSMHTWIYPMRQKREVFSHFQRFKNEVEKATGHHSWCLWSDGGKEYFSNEFMANLRKEGIRREFLCRHATQQNGVAKRKNQHIVEVARVMMNEKNLPKSYWAEAVNTSIYLMNKCTISRVHDITWMRCFLERNRSYHMCVFSAQSPTCIFPTRCDKSWTWS